MSKQKHNQFSFYCLMFRHLRIFVVILDLQTGKVVLGEDRDAKLIFISVFGGKFCFEQVLKNRASRVER